MLDTLSYQQVSSMISKAADLSPALISFYVPILPSLTQPFIYNPHEVFQSEFDFYKDYKVGTSFREYIMVHDGIEKLQQ